MADRVSGGLIGLLVGDALGVPYEFHPALEIPGLDEIEFAPPPDFRRSHRSVKPGTWSDDGSLALCLLASLLHSDGFDPRNFANRAVNWAECGYLAVDGHVFDIGNQTAESLRRLRDGADPLSAGGTHEASQGNGSLMRTLPLALWHRGSDEELVAMAQDQSRITHGHPVVLVSCALYCLWARQIMVDAADPWQAAVDRLADIYGPLSPLRNVLEQAVLPHGARPVRGSGYVLDSLFATRHLLRAGSFEQVVKQAVALGEDTDTTACIAGGLAGLRDGADAIPARWREALRGWEAVAPLHEALMVRWN